MQNSFPGNIFKYTKKCETSMQKIRAAYTSWCGDTRAANTISRALYICMHVHTNACEHARARTLTLKHTNTCTHTQIHTHKHVHSQIHTHTLRLTHTHKHTHT